VANPNPNPNADAETLTPALTLILTQPGGAGRHGIAGLGVGLGFGVHLGLAAALLVDFAFGFGADAPLWFGLRKGPLLQWAAYVCLLCAFHALEWYVTAAYRPAQLGYKSWIINHSEAYTAAMLASTAEFWLEYLLLPQGVSPKGFVMLSIVASGVCVASMRIRVLGMTTCGSNFDHIVMAGRKKSDHELVTHGVYARLRHPAYFGWFYWSIFGQVLLGNPICTLGFAAASRKFFADRIPYEEENLARFYGDRYVDYAARTPIGIPFVRGFVPRVRGLGPKPEPEPNPDPNLNPKDD